MASVSLNTHRLKESFKTLKWYEWVMTAILITIAGYAMVSAFVNPASSTNPPWLTVLNFISAVCGVMCIFFCAKADIANFAFAVVNTTVYIVYLFYWKIYGTMCLELFVYFPVNFISWWYWAKHRDAKDYKLTMSRKLLPWQNVVVTMAVAAGTVIYHSILVKYGSGVEWLDAATFAIGIIAVFLEMFRFREQYVWWIITDVVAVAMFIVHFDPVYLTKKLIYLIMAVVGLINWCKLHRERNAENV